jgi:hypothetical protein
MMIACVLLAVMSASAFLFAPMHQTAVYMRSPTCVASKGDAFDNQHTVEEAAEPGECRKYTAAAQCAEPLPALSIVRDRVGKFSQVLTRMPAFKCALLIRGENSASDSE